jgi:hypothetical protein
LTGKLSIKSGIVTDATQTGGGRAVRSADDRQSAGADYAPGAPPAFTLEGKNRHEEDGSLEAGLILVQHLAGMGRVYTGLRKTEADGIDCIADSSAGLPPLKLQVTRAVRGDFRAELAVTGKVSREYKNADEAADALRDAIQDKASKLVNLKSSIILSEITLVLDARETLSHVVDPAVVSSFTIRYGDWAKALGLAEIWLVGPAVAFVEKLA